MQFHWDSNAAGVCEQKMMQSESKKRDESGTEKNPRRRPSHRTNSIMPTGRLGLIPLQGSQHPTGLRPCTPLAPQERRSWASPPLELGPDAWAPPLPPFGVPLVVVAWDQAFTERRGWANVEGPVGGRHRKRGEVKLWKGGSQTNLGCATLETAFQKRIFQLFSTVRTHPYPTHTTRQCCRCKWRCPVNLHQG